MKLEQVLVKWYPWCLPFKDKLGELFNGVFGFEGANSESWTLTTC